MQSREEENEYLGNEAGTDAFDRHADKVGVLQFNNAAYALERQHMMKLRMVGRVAHGISRRRLGADQGGHQL